MKKHGLMLAIVFIAATALLFSACGNGDYEHKDNLTQDDGQINAKDRDPGVSCDSGEVRVEDCYDACSCCYFGQEDNMADCVRDCDYLLVRQNEVEHNPSKADYDRFNYCTLGCISLCGEREKEEVCWDECKTYLGL